MTEGYIAFFSKQAVFVDGEEYSWSYIKTHSGTVEGSPSMYSQTHSFSVTSPVAGARFVRWDCGGAEGIFEEIDTGSIANYFSTKWEAGQGVMYKIPLTAYFTTSAPPTPPEDTSAINLTLTGIPNGVGSLVGGGLTTGIVGSNKSYTVIADILAAMKGRYRFSHWIDDQNVKHKEKSFNKTFTFKSGYTPQNPELITFTAYFVACTGLILRSSSSGLILRGRANRILRDE